jgi:phospholipid/cholesterol/gamma-HCH transport system permease protein
VVGGWWLAKTTAGHLAISLSSTTHQPPTTKQVDERLPPSPPPAPDRPPVPPDASPRRLPLVGPLVSLGDATFFALRATLALGAIPLRFGELLTQFYRVLLGAVPIAILAGVAIGTVVWMQLRGVLQSVGGPGAVQYLPQGLSLTVVLVLGPVIAGLLTAARSGATLGAELGAMRLNEQIDALEVLGLSPMRELVAPRLAACMLALPVLTTFVVYLALGAGLLGELIGGSMTARQYVNECLRVLHLRDVVPAILKTVVYGYLIGLAGCWHGLNARGGTEGVGRAATGGVVSSLVGVLLAEIVLTRLIKLIF